MDDRRLDLEECYCHHSRGESCTQKPEDSAASDTGFVNIHNRQKSLIKVVALMGSISAGLDNCQF